MDSPAMRPCDDGLEVGCDSLWPRTRWRISVPKRGAGRVATRMNMLGPEAKAKAEAVVGACYVAPYPVTAINPPH